MKAILDGIRIVDWTQWIAGPESTAMLGELGADVYKIEFKGVGDQERGVEKYMGASTSLPHGRHSLVEYLNRNKRGLALDLRNPRGKEIMYRLVERCDVFVTNFQNDVIDKFGLDYDSLREINPKLIYAISSAYGQRGPDGTAPGFDLTILARSGMMMACGDISDPDPCWIIPGPADVMGGYNLSFAVIAGILARERHGIGQKIACSNLGGMLKLLSTPISQYLLSGKETPRQSRVTPSRPGYDVYKCGDRRWIAIALFREGGWSPFCHAIGAPEMDCLEYGSLAKRAAKAPEIVKFLDRIFATKTRDEWIRIFRDKNVVHAPVNTIAEAVSESQVLENGYVCDWDHPVLGKIRYPGFPWEFSETPAAHTRGAPELGEHTEEIMIEVCGYDWDQITRFKEEGVI